ncbi:uncharacterized protein LOC141651080 [Silene latifolia]|uniref:uncharacterized protein LOC141651080 n=1 Tax=Silene latifolia TaxID=37657 RepID=UPI003D77660C
MALEQALESPGVAPSEALFWQLCNEALATRANIASRVRGECSFCSFCNSFLESSVHLFRDCPIAKRVWEGLDLSMEEEEGCGDLRSWVEERWRVYGSREHMLFMVGCWALWEHRNSVIFYTKEVNPQGVIRRTWDVVEEIEGGGYGRLNQRGVGGREEQAVRKGWTRPPEDFVKVNVDAGTKEGEGISVGVICRDERGEVMWGVSEVMEQNWEPQFAEAVAVLEGMKEAKRRGHQKIMVESDCLVLIESLKKKKSGRNMFALILDVILLLCISFNSVAWSYTSRTNNGAAHALAHLFPRVVGRLLWSGVLPPTVDDFVTVDSLLVMQ